MGATKIRGDEVAPGWFLDRKAGGGPTLRDATGYEWYVGEGPELIGVARRGLAKATSIVGPNHPAAVVFGAPLKAITALIEAHQQYLVDIGG